MEKKTILRAVYGSPDRPLVIGNVDIPCYVLEDNTRVISQRGLQKSLGMSEGGGKGGARKMTLFLGSLADKGTDIKDLAARADNPIEFLPPRGGRSGFGYEATLLADICEAILQARQDGKFAGDQRLQDMATVCETLMRGWARVGIIALVDEATGFQEVRARLALQQILDKFIAQELQPWVKTFDDEFYKHIFRLNNWPYTDESIRKRPGIIGKWTNDIIYERLAPGVRDELHRLTERDAKGRLKTKLFQHLTKNVGYQELVKHISGVTALMRAATKWDSFKRMLQRAYPKQGELIELDLDE